MVDFTVTDGHTTDHRVVVAMTYPYTNVNEYYGNVDILACKEKQRKIPPHIAHGPW